MTRLLRQRADGLLRQRPEVDGRSARSPSCASIACAAVALGGQRDEQAGGAVPAGDEVDELDGGRAGIVDVVEDDEQRVVAG